MEDQSVGDTRTSATIPTQHLRPLRKSVVTKRRWAGALLDNPRFFMVDRRASNGPWSRGSRGLRLVMKRGTGRKRRQRIMYVIPKFQRIKPRFPFQEIAESTAKREFNAAFPFQLQRALETAK